jgi:hypothetical protein
VSDGYNYDFTCFNYIFSVKANELLLIGFILTFYGLSIFIKFSFSFLFLFY